MAGFVETKSYKRKAGLEGIQMSDTNQLSSDEAQILTNKLSESRKNLDA